MWVFDKCDLSAILPVAAEIFISSPKGLTYLSLDELDLS